MFNAGSTASMSKGPKSRMCYICGRQTLLAGFDFHVTQCRDLFIKREELKPRKERRAVPVDPMIAYEAEMQRLSSRGSAGGAGGGVNLNMQQHLDAINTASEDAFKATLSQCQNCGRRFLPEKLAIHNRSCTALKPAKSVGFAKTTSSIDDEIAEAERLAERAQARAEELKRKKQAQNLGAADFDHGSLPSIRQGGGISTASSTAPPALFNAPRQPSEKSLNGTGRAPSRGKLLPVTSGLTAVPTFEEYEQSVVAAALNTCPSCGRHFNDKAFEKHAPICRKVFVEHRTVFDSSKARAKGTEIESFKKNPQKPSGNPRKQGSERTLATTARIRQTSGNTQMIPSVQYNSGGDANGLSGRNWKKESNAFRAAMKAARQVARAEKQAKATGVPLRDLLPARSVLPSAEDPAYADYVTCPHCNRRYNQTAGARHIPKCKDIFAKPSRLSAGSGQVATTSANARKYR